MTSKYNYIVYRVLINSTEIISSVEMSEVFDMALF